MFSLGPIETVVTLVLVYFAFRTWLQRRWPVFERKLKISLYASAAAVVTYKIFLTLMARQ